GGNLRMTPIAATLALSHLERIDELIARKAYNVGHLTDRLCQLPGLTPAATRPDCDLGARFGVHVVYDERVLGRPRENILLELRSAGLKVGGPQTEPLHRLALFSGERVLAPLPGPSRGLRFGYKARQFPIAERLAQSWLSLPADYLYGHADRLIDDYAHAFGRVLSR
ncbi:DegT/DnrJ/EryC1/StrS family aminotransferase, partial [Frankia sp. Cr1]|uniref:DegT/DnrJ/EryC1/StrS family aminotransferase n=1 Tax=Frankia sp. Cr1 TaxID=3073931 RepID=UPI002AD4E010